jgi:hypothetical protein
MTGIGFLSGPALSPSPRSASSSRCAPRRGAILAQNAPASTVSLDKAVTGAVRLSLSGPDVPFLLREVSRAVKDAGLRATRISCQKVGEGSNMVTSEILLDPSTTEAASAAVRTKISDMWNGASASAPPPSGTDAPETHFKFLELAVASEENIESGRFFNLDPYNHATYTTLTMSTTDSPTISSEILDVIAAKSCAYPWPQS